MKLVISTSALIGRSPIEVRRFCSHSGDGPFLTPRTSRSAKPGQRLASSTVTFTGQGNSPLIGLIEGSMNLPMSAAERSRAMPCTPAQSCRFGVGLLLGRNHPRNRKRRQGLRLVLDMLDLEPDHGELVGKLFQRLVGVEMFLQPGEREFHGCGPRIPLLVFSGILALSSPFPPP